MLITFKSDADGDVIMFGQVGQLMLECIGKDPADARGIITVAQLPEAIESLRAAIERDKAAQAPPDQGADKDGDEDDAWREAGLPQPDPQIRFAQRAVPLLDMLLHSERSGVAVIWES
jgi:hypothetical protein